MNKFLFDALSCPFCSGEFTVSSVEGKPDDCQYAVLSCYCEKYPVVAGIPVIRKGIIGNNGETTRTVSELIVSGKHQEALLAVTMPPPPASDELAPAWSHHLPKTKGIGRIKNFFSKAAMPQWIKSRREFFAGGPEGKTAAEYIKMCLGMRDQSKDYNAMMHRFGQPRQLVSLSLMTVIESPRGPVLDFGCGFGHLTCHLVRKVGPQPIIGVDLDFVRVYIAKNFLAPEALYVCCDGNTSLPFRNGFFSTVYSSDTLFMVPNKVICTRELRRVIDREGLIVIPGIRNGLVEPEKYPITMTVPYHAYGKLFDPLPHRVLNNAEIIDRYIKKCGPALKRSSERRDMEQAPWFSLVATNREELLDDRGSFADWPHAEGVLELNPLYRHSNERNGSGDTVYCHKFPSSWYQQEDGDCRKYQPESVSISSQVLNDLASRKRTLEMENLIAQCVFVGFPERFH